MSDVRESIVLCEGFDDRAFWQGLLLSLGCQDARRDSSIHRFNAVFTYRTPSGRLAHVVPCHPRENQRVARRRGARGHRWILHSVTLVPRRPEGA